MTTITATQARKRFFNLLDEANASHAPILISGKRGGPIRVVIDLFDLIVEEAGLI